MACYGKVLPLDNGEQEDGDEDDSADDELAVPPYPAKRIDIEQHHGGGGDDADNSETEHHHHALDDNVVGMTQQPAADGQHQQDGQQQDSSRGTERPNNRQQRTVAGMQQRRVARIGGDIDADRSRRHLADSQNIRELLRRNPAMGDDDLTLYKGYHGIAPTKGEETYLQKSKYQLEKHGDKLRIEN